MTPGRKFSATMSAVSAMRRNTALPSSERRSRAMLRLFRFSARKPPAMSWVRREPMRRVSSPVPGRSTLMTSAPMSASSMVHMGPAMICVRSSTLTPTSGPAG